AEFGGLYGTAAQGRGAGGGSGGRDPQGRGGDPRRGGGARGGEGMILEMAAAMALDTICPGPELSISGEFRTVESRHPNGTELRYGFVVTPEPICMAVPDGTREAVSGRWVQISWADGQLDRPHPGDQVEVTASFFEPHTAWHLG